MELSKTKPKERQDSWGSDGNHHSRGSWGSDRGLGAKDVAETLMHIREIMTQFLSKLPPTVKESEDILPVLMGMLEYKPD